MGHDEAQLGEFDLIRRYFSRIGGARSDVLLGVGDDAALLRMPEDAELVAAVDTLVAGRHFPLDSDARSIGHRALAVNLSDLAAMGATPAWATLALTLPSADPDWLERFSAGLGRSCERVWRGPRRRRHHGRTAHHQRASHGACRPRHGFAPQRCARGRPFGGDRYLRRCGRGVGVGNRLANDQQRGGGP